MKRFLELVSRIRDEHASDDFFEQFEELCRREPSRKKHYRSYDDTLLMLDDESWNILSDKAIDHFRDERPGQRKQGFFNQLNEAFAYRYLTRRGFEDIRFLKEAHKKTPDISFSDGGSENYCEVKTVGISDAEITRRETRGAQDGNVYFDLSNRVKRALESHVEEAWEQIRSIGTTGLVFIVIRIDDIAGDHYKRNRKQLVEFCRTRSFENLVIKVNHRGNQGIRIKSKYAGQI